MGTEITSPTFTILCGPAGAGKTTVIDQLLADFTRPPLLIVDHALEPAQLRAALRSALIRNQCILLETRLTHREPLTAMQRARELGYRVDLIVVGLDDIEIARQRMRRNPRAADWERMWEHTWQYLPPAVEQAHRAMVVDNTGGTASEALQINQGQTATNEVRPNSWMTERLLIPLAQRQLSLAAIRQALSSPGSNTGGAILQPASLSRNQPYQGRIVDRSEHHVLQELGNLIHIIHDLALVPTGGGALIKGLVQSIDYRAADAPEMSKTVALEQVPAR